MIRETLNKAMCAARLIQIFSFTDHMQGALVSLLTSFPMLISVTSISDSLEDLTEETTRSLALATSRLTTVFAGASVAILSLFTVPIIVMGHKSVAALKMQNRAFVRGSWMVPIVVLAIRLHL